MSKGKLWGIILFILIVLGFGIWLYTSSNVKKDVDREGIEILDEYCEITANRVGLKKSSQKKYRYTND